MTRQIGIVVIGRNEGERLKRCLASVHGYGPVVYVDSGSTDGSVDHALSIGVKTVKLDTDTPFTAARARNAGLRYLAESGEQLTNIQFIDGDCEMRDGWLEAGAIALERQAELAAVFGRLRERHPETSFYNRLCDDEWNVPVGPVAHCGGVAMYRSQPLIAAGGFDPSLIAGEEPDLCLRLRRSGWKIRRIDTEMAWHDAAMTRFSQWWTRARRAGHAFAEHVWRHRSQADPEWKRQLASLLVWGGFLPAALLVLSGIAAAGSTLAGVSTLVLIALVALQWVRIAFRKWRQSSAPGFSAGYALFILAAKIAGFAGALQFLADLISGHKSRLIEYRSKAS